jgi:hypothetical protein
MNNNNQKWIIMLLNSPRNITLKDLAASLKLQGGYTGVNQ